MEQSSDQRSLVVPKSALTSESGEVAQLIGLEERTLDTESGAVSWPEPKAHLPKLRKAFFPQSTAMGLAVDEDLSPALMRKAVPLAAKLPSFASAASSVNDTLEVQLATKRLERLAERFGTKRVAERDATVAQWEALTVPQKLKGPPGVKAPSVVCVSCDNGRIQRCHLPEEGG